MVAAFHVGLTCLPYSTVCLVERSVLGTDVDSIYYSKLTWVCYSTTAAQRGLAALQATIHRGGYRQTCWTHDVGL